jgi:hypothetical protein
MLKGKSVDGYILIGCDVFLPLPTEICLGSCRLLSKKRGSYFAGLMFMPWRLIEY